MLRNDEEKKPVTSVEVLSAFEAFQQHFLEFLRASSSKEAGIQRLLNNLTSKEDATEFFALLNKNISRFKFLDTTIKHALSLCNDDHNEKYIKEINKRIDTLENQHYKAIQDSKGGDVPAGAFLQMRFLKDVLVLDDLLQRYVAQDKRLKM